MSPALPPLVFFGSGEFGLPVLRELVSAGCVKLVVSQPDRPAGRGGALTPTPVSAFALERGVTLMRPEDCNAPQVVEEIRSAGVKAFAVVAYGQKMGVELLRDVFAVNLHGSLLPRWRGAAPYQRAIMEGDGTAGVTVIQVAERMDAGAMFARAELPIGPSMTAGELHDALSALGPGVMLSVLREWAAGHAQGEPQDEAKVTRARKLSKADAWVDFSKSADAVRARINGLSPWPGCMVSVAQHPLKVLRAEKLYRVHMPHLSKALPESDAPGTYLTDGTVACGEECVRFLEVQPAGGRPMPFDAWCRGRGVVAGARVISAPPNEPAGAPPTHT